VIILETCIDSHYCSGPFPTYPTDGSLWKGKCTDTGGVRYCFGLKTIPETVGGVRNVIISASRQRSQEDSSLQVAILRIRIDSLTSFGQIKQLGQQVSVLQELRHNNITAFVEAIHTSNCLYLVTWWAGLTLKMILEEQTKIGNQAKLSKEPICQILIGFLSA